MKINIVTRCLLLICMLAAPSCGPVHDVYPQNIPLNLDAREQQLANTTNAFTLELFKRTAVGRTKENIVLSPLGASMTVGMALAGTKGATQAEILEALRFGKNTPAKDIYWFHRRLRSGLSYVDMRAGVGLEHAVWLARDVTLKERYTNLLQDVYDVVPDTASLLEPAAAASWLYDGTEWETGSIGLPSEPDYICLLNSYFYGGRWRVKFDPSKTLQETFTLADLRTSKAKFMAGLQPMNTGVQDGIHVYEIPCGYTSFSMTIITSGVASLDANVVSMLDTTHWNSWTNSLHPDTNTIAMPRFNTVYTTKLDTLLKSMGMRLAFSRAGDFSEMSDNSSLYLSYVAQSTAVRVDEDGAMSAAGSAYTRVSDVPTYKLDHPFLYVIRERESGLILCIGVLNNPAL